MVKHVVKPLFTAILKGSIVPKKSVFTRAFGVFRDFIMRGRCLAPKPSALPLGHTPRNIYLSIIANDLKLVKTFKKNNKDCRDY